MYRGNIYHVTYMIYLLYVVDTYVTCYPSLSMRHVIFTCHTLVWGAVKLLLKNRILSVQTVVCNVYILRVTHQFNLNSDPGKQLIRVCISFYLLFTFQLFQLIIRYIQGVGSEFVIWNVIQSRSVHRNRKT